eukprot:m.120634 g.120634  ORF g.120634 m.120634 type:complete len:152 (-) comp28819_c0_seq1:153-608(-)
MSSFGRGRGRGLPSQASERSKRPQSTRTTNPWGAPKGPAARKPQEVPAARNTQSNQNSNYNAPKPKSSKGSNFNEAECTTRLNKTYNSALKKADGSNPSVQGFVPRSEPCKLADDDAGFSMNTLYDQYMAKNSAKMDSIPALKKLTNARTA